MDVERFLRDDLSRRSFFQTTGVTFIGGSAVFLAACGSSDKSNTNAETSSGRSSDVEILNGALALEHMAVAAYAAGAPLLKGAVLAIGKQFLTQEQEHANGLTQAIKSMGGTTVKPKSKYEFPDLKTQDDVLRFANDIEHTAVAAYIDALPKLQTPALRGTAAAIVTNEAEHISVLLGALKKPQVPSAFVVGQA